jgi:hypothetical protein
MTASHRRQRQQCGKERCDGGATKPRLFRQGGHGQLMFARFELNRIEQTQPIDSRFF